MSTTRYAIIEPSTYEAIDERIRQALPTKHFAFTGERILNDLAARRGKVEKKEFTCIISSYTPPPDWFVLAETVGTSPKSVRIELLEGRLEATVVNA